MDKNFWLQQSTAVYFRCQAFLRCRALLQRCAGPEILFSDENIFTIEAFHNHQNDRIWAKNSPQSDKIVTHSHPQSVMVWAGICASDKTPLVFVDPGVKINKNYYLQEILQSVLEPWARVYFRNREWIFQQDLLQPTRHEMFRSGVGRGPTPL